MHIGASAITEGSWSGGISHKVSATSAALDAPISVLISSSLSFGQGQQTGLQTVCGLARRRLRKLQLRVGIARALILPPASSDAHRATLARRNSAQRNDDICFASSCCRMSLLRLEAARNYRTSQFHQTAIVVVPNRRSPHQSIDCQRDDVSRERLIELARNPVTQLSRFRD